MFGIGFLVALLSPIAASALPPAFTLGGTAFRSWDPTGTPMTNFVVAMDTSATGSFGFATRTLNAPIGSLAGFLHLEYYLAGRDCGGGSPRISLGIDTTGDGVRDHNAFGYVGPSPSFTGCTMDSWQYADLTDGALRWDLTQFGGPFYNTWSQVLTFFEAIPPATVVRGSLVDDSAWMTTAAGLAYYDNVVIGDQILAGPEDVISSDAPVHLDVASDHVVDFDFGTIQAAVNAAASSGDTVLVDAGTYSELVSVTKDVAILGSQAGFPGYARGPGGESVVGTPNGAFAIFADNVVIDGFTITGVDSSVGYTSYGAGIWTTGATSGHVVRNNIITGNTMGLYLNSDGTYPSVVEYNLFDSNNVPGAASGDAIYSDQGANGITIAHNQFTGHESGVMVFAGGSQSDIAIVGNEIFDDAGGAVFFFTTGLEIRDNSWTDILYTSVFFGGGVHDVLITGNTFQAAGYRGIRVLAGLYGDTELDTGIVARFNSFEDNGEEGLRVDTASYSGTLDASCNWWGDVTGPAIASNPPGTGDEIFDPDGVVTFTPWLSSPTPEPCGGPVHLDIGSNGIIDVNFGTIQPAVNTAGDGDTIYVDPGVYTEQVVIDAGIRLVSSVTGAATIRAPPFAGRNTFTIPTSGRTWDAIVEIRADDASIEGFVVDGFERGGFCPSRSFTGIMMHGGVGMAALENTVTRIRDTPFSGCQAGTGIAVYPDAEGVPATADVSGNTVVDYQKGGIVVNVDGVTADVNDNVVQGIGPTGVIAQNGIQFGFGAGGSALGNTVTGNAYTGGYWTSAGILLYLAEDGVLVEDNLAQDNQIGIDVWGSSGVKVRHNDVLVGPAGLFSACGGPLGATDLFGMHFQDSEGLIAENDVTGIAFAAGARGCQSGNGIVLDGETTAIVSGNSVAGYQKNGIVAGRFSNDVDDSVLYAEIVDNHVTGWGPTPLIAQNGIQVSDGASGEVAGNDVSGNWYSPCGDYLTCYNAAGILSVETAGVLVIGNVLTGNQAGVNLYATDDVDVIGNTIDSSAWAIIVDASDPLIEGNAIGAPSVMAGAVQIVGIWALGSSEVLVRDNAINFGGAVPPVGTLYGIYFDDSSGSIKDNDVLGVRMTDAYFGLQTGVGIVVTGESEVDVLANTVLDYQKGGIVAGRAGDGLGNDHVVADIEDNTVTGRGPTGLIAQNGIQAADGTLAHIAGNVVTGNAYTGGYWTSAGILLYLAGDGASIEGNTLLDNQVGIDAVLSDDASVLDNHVSVGSSGLFTACGGSLGATSLFGIHFEESTGSIVGNRVADIKFGAGARGCQSGVGIVLEGESSGLVQGNEVTGYQKGGIVAGRFANPLVGAVEILDNVVTGWGLTGEIAQNGIQVLGPMASGSVRGNAISGNDYTGCSNRDAAKTGCTPWVAAGLLLYDVHANLVRHSNNEYRDNQRNLVMVTTQSLGF